MTERFFGTILHLQTFAFDFGRHKPDGQGPLAMFGEKINNKIKKSKVTSSRKQVLVSAHLLFSSWYSLAKLIYRRGEKLKHAFHFKVRCSPLNRTWSPSDNVSES